MSLQEIYSLPEDTGSFGKNILKEAFLSNGSP
jgi:hypothetical protein